MIRPGEDSKPKRVPVDYRYDSVNPTFLKMMAQIGAYAAEKYGSWEQYASGRLTGDKSPVNHIYEHLRSYVMQERHDRFGDPRWHLVALAYNAMMSFYYHSKWGPERHPLHLDKEWPYDEANDKRGRAVLVKGYQARGRRVLGVQGKATRRTTPV